MCSLVNSIGSMETLFVVFRTEPVCVADVVTQLNCTTHKMGFYEVFSMQIIVCGKLFRLV